MELKSNIQKPRRLQFSVRTFLIAVGVVSVLLSVASAVVFPWYVERSKIAMLKQVNAQVFTEPRGQFLIRQFIGDTFSERSVCLHLDDSRVDDNWIKKVGGMQHIEVLSIKSSEFSDIGLMELRNWPKLQDLNLVDTKVTDKALAALKLSLPNLRVVQSRKSEK